MNLLVRQAQHSGVPGVQSQIWVWESGIQGVQKDDADTLIGISLADWSGPSFGREKERCLGPALDLERMSP